MRYEFELTQVSDNDLLERLNCLLEESRRTESGIVAHIAEVESRRLYAREAFSSMHAYCTGVLHLSDAEAYLRIAVGRAARQYPGILERLADGRLHLSAIAKIAPHLTAENHAILLARATHKTKRQVEELVAELAPRPDVPMVIRKLPTRLNVASALALESCEPPTSPDASSDPPSDPPCAPAPDQVTWTLPSGPTLANRAARSFALQGPVHRERRVPREARAAPGTDAMPHP